MVLIAPAMAAPCTPEQRAELAKLGYGETDIKKLCGNASALFEKAYIAKESGDLKTAQQLFEQGLRIEPGNTLGQKLLAEVKESLGSAQKLFDQGYAARLSGDLTTAQQLFEQGLKIEPGNALGHKLLAEVRQELLSSARKLFEQAYEAKQSGDLRAAQRLFEQGLSMEPGNPLGQKFLAEVNDALSEAQRLFERGYNAKQSGDLRTAQQLFEQGLRIDPANTQAQKYLAEVKSASNSIAAMSPGMSFRDCAACPEMVVIPAGSFTMGSPDSEADRFDIEGPQHQVSIPRPFAVGKYEVTFDEWDACVREGGCTHNPSDSGWGRGRRPVINVSWHDAKAYAEWLSRKSGANYRLLTEAEWEYAARAGTTTPFSFGTAITLQQANSNGNRSWLGLSLAAPLKTLPVGSYAPNAFGLYDVHGNVHEWTESCFSAYVWSAAPRDGSARTPGNCAVRVRRGGAWGNYSQHLRSAGRGASEPSLRENAIGFRVSRTD
ncbi:MAG: SUMF1/EgtB/PvdO family nonheme iron enzyme [Betaproteobacteria bacterium]